MSEKTFNPDAVINPSSGMYARNPSHIEEAKYASDQNEISQAIKKTGTERRRVFYDYKQFDPKDPFPLMGILKIKEMNEKDAIDFCKSLMRIRPNIFHINVKLGNYPNQRRIDNAKVRFLSGNKPRFHTEVGEKMGELLADKDLCITEIVYTVNNAEPGYYSSVAEVYGVSKEEYDNDELFSPAISFEFIKTT